MNDEIVFPVIRVVVANPDGKDEMLGVMSREEAIAAADDRGQDLVVVSPDANPPVCKIINYDKLRYENEKKEKFKKKNTRNAEIKEVKLSYKIDVHDYDVRKRAATKFLLKGDKVKASIRFKGREMAHQELAHRTMMQLMQDTEEIAAVEKRPLMEGRQMQMILAPTPEVLKAAELKRKAAKGSGKKGKFMDDDSDDGETPSMSEEEEETSEEEVEDAPRADYDLDQLSLDKVEALIGEVGNNIRELKAAEAPKARLAPHVEELLALKARFEEISGEAWAPKESAAK